MDPEDGVWGGWPKRGSYVIKGWEEFQRQLVQYSIKSASILFRRHIVVEAGGFTKLPLLCSHDWYLSLRACLLGDIAFLDEPLVAQRKHGGNLSGDMTRQTDAAQMEIELFGVIDDVIARAPPAYASEAQLLQKTAHRNVAGALMSVVRWARNNGMVEQAEEMECMIQKYVPLAELEAGDAKPGLKQQIVGLGTPLIKRFTYKKLSPLMLKGR